MIDNAEHADIVEGVPVVLGDPELAGRLVVVIEGADVIAMENGCSNV